MLNIWISIIDIIKTLFVFLVQVWKTIRESFDKCGYREFYGKNVTIEDMYTKLEDVKLIRCKHLRDDLYLTTYIQNNITHSENLYICHIYGKYEDL